MKPGTSIVWDHRFRLTAERSAPSGVHVRALGEEGRRALAIRGESAPVPALAALPVVVGSGRILAVPALDPASGYGIAAESLLSRRIAEPPLFPDLVAEE